LFLNSSLTGIMPMIDGYIFLCIVEKSPSLQLKTNWNYDAQIKFEKEIN